MSKQKKNTQKKTSPQEKAGVQLFSRLGEKAKDSAKNARKHFKRSFFSMMAENERAIKRQRTWKEIAVIAISIIMVVSILFPSFALLFGGNQNSTPTSFESAIQIYTPKVEKLQQTADSHKDNAADMLALADEQYTFGKYATQFANSEDQQNQAKSIMKKAINSYTTYLNLAGALSTYEQKNAVVSRALCNLYIGDSATAITQLKDLLKETNFAPAWQSLGMIYESQSKTNEAIDAYQKAIGAPVESQQDVRNYCETRLKALKAQNAQSSGGASALNAQLSF